MSGRAGDSASSSLLETLRSRGRWQRASAIHAALLYGFKKVCAVTSSIHFHRGRMLHLLVVLHLHIMTQSVKGFVHSPVALECSAYVQACEPSGAAGVRDCFSNIFRDEEQPLSWYLYGVALCTTTSWLTVSLKSRSRERVVVFSSSKRCKPEMVSTSLRFPQQ